MNHRTLLMTTLLTSMGGALSIAACASYESGGAPNEGGQTILQSDAGPDATGDVNAADGDAGPCTGCEWFPADCMPEIPCESGPFDPSTAGGAIDGRARIHSIRGRSASDVWAVGALGAVARFDGTSWSRLDIGNRATTKAIWLRDDTELLLTSMHHFHSHDAGATSWFGIDLTQAFDSPVPDSLSPSSYLLTSAWAAEGATWMWCTSVDSSVAPTYETPPGLWRLRYTTTKADGLEVAAVAIPTETCELGGQANSGLCQRLNGVHGIDKSQLWAVGSRGVTFHVTDADGDTPNVLAFNSHTENELRAVWTASATEAWSVGAAGTIRHYAGDPVHWDVVVDVPVSSNLNAIWGTSPSDVWAVGDDAVVLHYDGVRWSRVPVGGLGVRRPNLTTVWSPSPGQVWIGGDGIILSLGGKP